MAAEDIVIGVNVHGEDKLYRLSNAVNQLNAALSKTKNPTQALNAASRGLSAAIGSTGRSMNDHAKTVSQMMRNQAALSTESKKVARDIADLKKNISQLSNEEKRAIPQMQQYAKALNSIKARALVSDLKAISQEQKRLGKDAQFVGRSLIIGLTTPLVGIGRMGLQSLVAIDKEFVRLNKVLESVAPNAEKAMQKLGDAATPERVNAMVDSFNELDKSLDSVSQKFGVAKSLVVGLSADFAELGVTNTKNIAKLTELTAATEKLGSMDISAAQDLVQSLYFQAVRSFTLSGREFKNAMEREQAAINAATAQLNMFNLVENTTALTLRDLGDAFPEVAAAATSFGLSMTEAAALLAPMKAAGFEIGASANSIKVSLQRVTAPTKQNADMFKQLSKEYNTNFNLVKGTGLDAIQNLIDGFNELKASTAGQEGALEFMAKVFGVRQGPRMEVAIQQMATFDKTLKSSSVSADLAEKQIQNIANTTISSMNKANGSSLPLIDSFKSIGVLARIATAQVGQTVEDFGVVTQRDIETAFQAREAIGRQILQANREGRDLIAEIGTEAGRAMIVQLAGATTAQEITTRELDAALQSLDTQINVIKNNFKLFAAELLSGMKPAIEKVSELTTKIINAFKALDPETKKMISNFVLFGGATVAAIGPLVFIFGQARLAMGVLNKVALGLLPSLKNLTVAQVAQANAMMRLKSPLTIINGVVTNTNGKFSTFIATLASGGGPLGTFANKVGMLTGVLKKSETAGISLQRAVSAAQTQATATTLGTGALTGAIGPQGAIAAGRAAPARQVAAIAAKTGVPLRVGGRFATPEQVVADALATRAQMIPGQNVMRGPGGRFRALSASQRANINILAQANAVNARQQALAGLQSAPNMFFGRAKGLGISDAGDFTLKGREISQARGQAIARGGVRGIGARVAEIPGAMGARISAGATNLGASVKSLSAKPVDAFKNALNNAKVASNSLGTNLGKLGVAQPGIFKRASMAVKGFATSFGSVTKAMHLMKLAWIATGIGAAILAVAAIVYIVVKNFEEFKEKAKPGVDALKSAFDALKSGVMAIFQPFINLITLIGSGGKEGETGVGGIASAFNMLAEVVGFIGKVIAGAFKIIGKVINYFLGNFASIFRGVTDVVKGVSRILKGDLLGGFKQAFGGIIKAVYGLLGPFRGVFDIIFSILTKFVKMAAWALGWIPGLGGAIKKAANGMEQFQNFLKDSAKIPQAAQKAGKEGARGVSVEIKKSSNTIQETISNAVGEGMAEGADKGGNSLKKSIKDVKKQVKAAALDAFGEQMKEAVSTIVENFEKQKQAAIDAIDVQIETLEKLKAADESLTKTKEFEANKRAIIEERELNRQNYVRNRALAIYEGRIDDARMLGLEEKRSIQDSTRQKEQLEESRRRDLAQENFDFLRKSIEDSKKEAAKLFDDVIDKFQESAKQITKFPPTSIEQWNKQIKDLTKAATDGATEIETGFGTLFTNLETKINSEMPNKTVAPFTNKLDEILTEAKNKYGLNDENTGIIGATLQLISGIGAKFGGDTSISEKFNTGIINAIDGTFSTWSQTMVGITVPNLMGGIRDAMAPFTDGEGQWAQAVKTGLAVVTAEFERATAEMKTKGIKLTQDLKDLREEFNRLVSQDGGRAGGAGSGGGGGGGAGGGTGTSGKTGNLPGSGEASAANKRLMENLIDSDTGRYSVARSMTPQYHAMISAIKTISAGKWNAQNKEKDRYIIKWMSTQGQAIGKYTPLSLIESAWSQAKNIGFKTSSQFINEIGSKEFSEFNKKHGIRPQLKRYGGFVKGSMSQSVPALLHGGEFVISANAVNKMGIGALESINNMRFSNPSMSQPKVTTENYSTQNVNIYVDNFIGQEQWFESMMKEYNVKVVPRNQKAAGLENRVVRTYNGINRGM
jgi:TP901 family phage tail tape measure protein